MWIFTSLIFIIAVINWFDELFPYCDKIWDISNSSLLKCSAIDVLVFSTSQSLLNIRFIKSCLGAFRWFFQHYWIFRGVPPSIFSSLIENLTRKRFVLWTNFSVMKTSLMNRLLQKKAVLKTLTSTSHPHCSVDVRVTFSLMLYKNFILLHL